MCFKTPTSLAQSERFSTSKVNANGLRTIKTLSFIAIYYSCIPQKVLAALARHEQKLILKTFSTKTLFISYGVTKLLIILVSVT